MSVAAVLSHPIPPLPAVAGGHTLVDLDDARCVAIGYLRMTPAQPLATAQLPAGPGLYALSYTGDSPLLGKFAEPRSIVYVGKGSMRQRQRAHVDSIHSASGLEVEHFWIRAVAYRLDAEAAFAEGLVTNVLRPVFNDDRFAGLGSKAQGEGRSSTQAAAPFDVLFPGRPGRAQPTANDGARRQALENALRDYPALTWTGT